MILFASALNEPGQLLNCLAMENVTFLAWIYTAKLEMSASQRIDGIHDGGTSVAERKDKLLEGVAILFSKDDEMGENVAEMIDKEATVLPTGEFSKGGRTEFEERCWFLGMVMVVGKGEGGCDCGRVPANDFLHISVIVMRG